MARDAQALPIQGPDNGTGNPVLVTVSSAPLTAANITQQAGTALPTGVEAPNPLVQVQGGSGYAVSRPAAAAQAQVTVAAVASQSIRIRKITASNIGTASSGSIVFTVTDGGATILVGTTTVAASGSVNVSALDNVRITPNSALVVTFPAGAANSQWVLVVAFDQF